MLEAIDARVSRRKYQETAIAPEKATALMESAAQIHAAQGVHIQLILDGAQPFRGFSRSYGLLSGVQSYFALAGDTNDAHSKEKLGYFGEQLVLEATALGLGTCWVGGSYRKEDTVCELPPGQSLACVICVGNCAAQDSARERLVRSVVHRKGKSAAEMLNAQGTIPNWVKSGMQAVQKAPSANNKQPVLFQFNSADESLRAGIPGGGSALDLGIAKLHFAIGAGEAAQGRIWEWGQNAAFRIPSPAAP